MIVRAFENVQQNTAHLFMLKSLTVIIMSQNSKSCDENLFVTAFLSKLMLLFFCLQLF